MRNLIVSVLTLMMGLIISSCEDFQKEQVDLIIHNATIYTVDETFSKEEALAIRDGKILDIGPEHKIMNKYQSSQTLDVKKQFVYPGFIDGHCHFVGYGLSLQSVNLMGTKSWEECISKTKEFATLHPDGWITGRGWDQNDWDVKEYPNNKELSELFPDRPVILNRIDGHGAIANQKALDLAGITSETSIDGGMVGVVGGEPTGVLVDNAVDLVIRNVPQPNEEVLRKAILQAQKNCFSVGLTTVDDAGLGKTEIELIQKMHADSSLKMNVYAMVSNTPENLQFYLQKGMITSPKLTVRSVKVYADGALGSRGAALKKPYADDPHNHGLILTPINEMEELAKKLDAAGFQMNTHCIGDSANALLLHIYAEVLQGINDKRWRIEHAQIVEMADVELYKSFTIIPSVQPTHATSDMYWAEDRLGADRIKTAYAYQDLLEQNHILALGTDFPVEDISPLKTFYSAIFRQDTAGFPEGGFNMENAISREDALRGMTIWNAIANFEENEKGSLEIGKKANITILNMDLMKVYQESFDKLEVTFTIVDGEVVFEKQ